MENKKILTEAQLDNYDLFIASLIDDWNNRLINENNICSKLTSLVKIIKHLQISLHYLDAEAYTVLTYEELLRRANSLKNKLMAQAQYYASNKIILQ